MKMKLSFLAPGLFLAIGISSSLYAASPQAITKQEPVIELEMAKITSQIQTSGDKNEPLRKDQYKITGKSPVKIQKIAFLQANEDSSQYEVDLYTDDFTQDMDLSGKESTIVIKVKDKIFFPRSYGGKVTGTFCFVGLGSIDRATAEIINGGPLPLAPKDSLRVEYMPNKKYPLHSGVGVPVNITNIGNSPLTFYWGTTGGQNYPCRDTQQSFTATLDGVPVMPNPKPLPDGFISSPYNSTPKSVLHNYADLSQWLQFDKPGKYLIDAMYTITIDNPKQGATPAQWKVSYHNKFFIQIGD